MGWLEKLRHGVVEVSGQGDGAGVSRYPGAIEQNYEQVAEGGRTHGD